MEKLTQIGNFVTFPGANWDGARIWTHFLGENENHPLSNCQYSNNYGCHMLSFDEDIINIYYTMYNDIII